MRRRWLVLAGCLLLVSLGAVAAEPFVLEELHLVHWEQVPDGRPSFTGPVSAAVLMAWYAEHGYPALLPDLNGDGRTDEEDTILLARDFADAMGGNAFSERLTDPFVVYSLAHYVAERYPDTFRLLIYDESFPEEVERNLGRPFVPEETPGIVLDVLEDPFYELYVAHLEAGRPGIVGIGFDVPAWNDFAVSRSYVPGEHPDGMPVDLVSTGFDLFAPDPVWETVMRWEPDRWGFQLEEWVPFETLIILIPEEDAARLGDLPGDEPGDDPGDGPGDDPGDGPGDDPSGDPDGGDQPRYPEIPGGEPGGDPGGLDEGACCLPDGSCQQTSATLCTRLGGTYTPNVSCVEVDCDPAAGPPCAAAYGEITDICYTYDGDELTVYASYAIHNPGMEDAVNITAYALIGLNDGVNGFGGLADSQDWRYGLTIPSGTTYAYDVVYTTRAPNLDLDHLTYLYGSLWLQTPFPWDCWPIARQAFVQTWDPAPQCDPSGDRDGGEPGGDGNLVGACCLPDGTCRQLDEEACEQQDGLFYGPGVDCSEIRCFPAEDPPCAKLQSRVVDACQLYQGADQPMIVRADFTIANPGDRDARNVEVKLIAGVPLLANLMTTYNDEYAFTIPVIPAGGSHQVSHTFTISPAPPTQPTGQTAVMIFAAPSSSLCKPNVGSMMDIFHLLTFGPSERLCPTDGTPPGGDDEEAVCCLPDGSCMKLNATDCDAAGGAYISGETECAAVDCGKLLVGDCPKLSAQILDVCRTVDESDGSVTLHVTAEMENAGPGDAQNAELIAHAGWGFTGPNQTLYVGPQETWTGTLPAGQTVTYVFSLDIGTAPDWATFHPYVTVAAWIDDLPCDWEGENRVIRVDPDGSIPLCPPDEGEPGDRTTDPEDGTGTEPEPEPEPEPTGQPNLWVTDMTGCWTWSNDSREHVMATVTGVVHNGGQADATNVRARVTANGVSDTVFVGTIPAGGQKSVSATIDAGAYDSVSWPLPTSITADPLHQIDEADESNNTTDSSFPQSSDCN